MVPFRLRREDELASVWALNNAEAWLNRGLWRRYEFLFGSSDAWNPDLLANLPPTQSFQEFRAAITALQTAWPKKRHLDLVHGPSATLENEAGFRLRPSAPTLHGLLNQAIEGPRAENEQATGLELGVLLGSKLACELLGTQRSKKIKAQAPLPQKSHGLIGRSVLDLQLLLDAPEANTPPLFASDAWQRKSLATALGGWAQVQSVVVCHELRTRPLYVLYPWHGERILCRGSVLPYHEHFAPAPMTNEEWDAALAGADAISLPSWQAPLYTSDG